MPVGVGWVNTGAVRFVNQNFNDTILRQVHRDTQGLGDLLYANILERTPVRTGALMSSILEEVNTEDITNDDLIVFTVDEGPQMGAWNRVYWMYQEGNPLGLSTYTNAPHQMFYKVETDDLDLINAWIKGSIDSSLDVLAGGNGIPDK